jgi:ATP-dependent Clp protease protease subunit
MEIKIRGTLLSNRYADIMRWWGYTDFTCPDDIELELNKANGEDVTLFINSDGGSLMAGTEIYSILKRYKGNTKAHVQSRSASAATVAMMACKEIVAEPVALICIHNPSTWAEGDEYVFTHTAEELHNIKEAIIAAYMPRVKLSHDETAALMDKDVWLNAEQAKGYGLIDSIVDDGKKPEIVNTAGTLLFPTEKMIAEYDTHIQAQKKTETEIQAKRARAMLDLYR